MKKIKWFYILLFILIHENFKMVMMLNILRLAIFDTYFTVIAYLFMYIIADKYKNLRIFVVFILLFDVLTYWYG